MNFEPDLPEAPFGAPASVEIDVAVAESAAFEICFRCSRSAHAAVLAPASKLAYGNQAKILLLRYFRGERLCRATVPDRVQAPCFEQRASSLTHSPRAQIRRAKFAYDLFIGKWACELLCFWAQALETQSEAMARHTRQKWALKSLGNFSATAGPTGLQPQERYRFGIMKPAANISVLPVPAAPSDRFQAAEVFAAIHIALDPTRVRVWPGNARRYDRLNPTNCRDLIDSLVDAGGQQVPALLRRVHGDPEFDFEVIAGVRRHFAVSWLKANGHPHLQFLGVVHELTDEQAFFTADLENRTRKDVSDIERARSYRGALRNLYDGNQSRMAARLRISKGWLSKMLTVAEVPDAILEAFENVEKVSLAGLYPVARLLHDPALAGAIAEEATRIAIENGNRSWDKAKPISEPEVIRRLKSVALPQSTSPQRQPPVSSSAPTGPIGLEIQSPEGHSIVTVIGVDMQGVTLRLHNYPGVQHQDVLEAVAKVMEQLGR